MGFVEKKTQGIDNKFNNLKLAGEKNPWEAFWENISSPFIWNTLIVNLFEYSQALKASLDAFISARTGRPCT